tara:strand:+ start:1359 stop:3602 length:2244 start_codon:yes stop_codon:yes gene_type:complete
VLLKESLGWDEDTSHDWNPVRSQGFMHHELPKGDDDYFSLIDQTPEWKRLSDPPLPDASDIDPKVMQFQEELRPIMQQNYVQSLKSARKHILHQGLHEYDCYTVMDAFLHQSESDFQEYFNTDSAPWDIMAKLFMTEGDEASRLENFIEALEVTLTSNPRGPTNNILSKRREPESRTTDEYLSTTGLSLVMFALITLEGGSTEMSFQHEQLCQRLGHIAFRLKLGNPAVPLGTYTLKALKMDVPKAITQFEENPTFSTALRIKDYLHCIYRRFDESSVYSPTEIRNHIINFSTIVKASNLQPDVIESVTFVEIANAYEIGDRIESLRYLSQHAMSPFLRGMAAYTGGCLIHPKHDSKARNNLLFDAIECFTHKDTTRKKTALEVLARGQFDFDDEERGGLPARVTPEEIGQKESAAETLLRIIGIIEDLLERISGLSSPTVESILQEIHNYLNWRIQLTRKRCTSCNKIHAQGAPEVNPLEADESSWNLLKELYSQMGQDEVTQQSAAVVKDSIELIEFALASVCHSKEALRQIESHDSKLSASLLSEIDSPESVLGLYIGEHLIDDIFHKTYNLLNHLNENHISPEKAIQVLELYEVKFREQKELSSQEQLTGEFVFATLSRLGKKFKPKQWIEEFPEVSIKKSRDIQSNSEGTSKGELFDDLIMAIAIRNDFYDAKFSEHNSDEEVSEMIKSCMKSLPLKESMRYVAAVLHEGIEDLTRRDEQYQGFKDYHETLEQLIRSSSAKK